MSKKLPLEERILNLALSDAIVSQFTYDLPFGHAFMEATFKAFPELFYRIHEEKLDTTDLSYEEALERLPKIFGLLKHNILEK